MQATLPRYQLQAVSALVGGTILAEIDLPAGDYLLDGFIYRDPATHGGLAGYLWYGGIITCEGATETGTTEEFYRPFALITTPFTDHTIRVGWMGFDFADANVCDSPRLSDSGGDRIMVPEGGPRDGIIGASRRASWAAVV